MHYSPGASYSLPSPHSKRQCSSSPRGHDQGDTWLRREGSTSPFGKPSQDDVADIAFRMFLHSLGPCGRWAQDLKVKPNDPSCTGRKRPLDVDGALSQIKEMPLELVFEILLYLHPADLLNLARTNRRMRKILLSKSARFVWRGSLSRIRGLPPCPPDMSEPHFANLVFGNHCQRCGKDDVKDVFWACRVRYCSECFKEQFITEEKLEFLISEDLGIEKLASVFPYTVLNKHQLKRPSQVLYHLPTATQYLAEVEKILASMDVEEAISRWVREKKELQIRRIKHASLCEHWYNHWAIRTLPSTPEFPFFDLTVTAVLSTALVYLWKDRIFG